MLGFLFESDAIHHRMSNPHCHLCAACPSMAAPASRNVSSCRYLSQSTTTHCFLLALHVRHRRCSGAQSELLPQD